LCEVERPREAVRFHKDNSMQAIKRMLRLAMTTISALRAWEFIRDSIDGL